MSGPAGSSQWMYNAGSDYEIPFSLRFDGASGSYLHKTPSASASTRVWTFATWIKRSTLGGGGDDHFNILGISSNNNPTAGFRFQTDSLAYWDYGVGGTDYALNASTLETAKFVDTGAWAHVMIAVNTTHGTDTNRLKIYWNGVLQTLDNTNQGGQGNTYPDENADTAINASEYVTWIGASNSYGSFAGYMADTYFINNQQLTPASFGETGDFGEFKPIEYTGTYDAYSSYLDYADSGNLGDDESGNGADWAEAGIVATDQMLDTPTNNFATINALDGRHSGLTLLEGNLRGTRSAGAWQPYFATMAMPTGKWYWETYVKASNDIYLGITTDDYAGTGAMSDTGAYSIYSVSNGTGYKYDNGTEAQGPNAMHWGADIIVQCAYDADTGKFWMGKANTYFASGDPAAGSDPVFTVSAANRNRMLPAGNPNSSNTNIFLNYGQDSSFAGEKTAQSNQDGNDIGDFFYAPPSGFLALCTSNLAAAAVTPSEYFNTITYTGDASADNSITGVGFQPDWVWAKGRNLVINHGLWDSVRGVTKTLRSNSTLAESTDANALTSFNSDGFTANADTLLNGGYNYVAWNWKAGTSFSNDASSTSVGSIDSAGSIDTGAGFSIISYTGTGTAGTVAHGLAGVPEMFIVKNRDDTDAWMVYHIRTRLDGGAYGAPETDYLRLDTTAVAADLNTVWNDTAPTSSVFSIGTLADVNISGEKYIAYLFRSIDGYCKVGSWTGNANDNAHMVYTGFRPAWVMWKKTSGAENWFIVDTARSPFNPTKLQLWANDTVVEQTSGAGASDLDLLSNGFKPRGAGGAMNGNNETYIYLAFAEQPFKNSNAR